MKVLFILVLLFFANLNWVLSQSIQLKGKQVESFSYEENFQSFGNVTFATFIDEVYFATNADKIARFYLLKNNKPVYEFPEFPGNFVSSNKSFLLCEILGVSFKDFNSDGLKDVLVLVKVGESVNSGDFQVIADLYLQQSYKEFENYDCYYNFLNDKVNSSEIESYIDFLEKEYNRMAGECFGG